MESRLLSKIPFPDNKNCESDTSDNGQLLYLLCYHSFSSPSNTLTGLQTFDVSNPQNPREIGNAAVGTIEGQLTIRGGAAFILGNSKNDGSYSNNTVSILDVRDPIHPILKGKFDLPYSDAAIHVSDDGKAIFVRHAGNKYLTIDSSDLANPHEVSTTADMDFNKLHDWTNYESVTLPDSSKAQVKEQRNGKLLTEKSDEAYILTLYDESNPQSLRVLSTFPGTGDAYGKYHLIADDSAIAVEAIEDHHNRLIEILPAKPIPFNAANLKTSYEEAATASKGCPDTQARNAECYPVWAENVRNLFNLGIKKLLDEEVEGVSRSERAQMLSDYGFWLGHLLKESNKAQAKVIIEKAAELDPDNASVWLRLGDINRAKVPLALTDEEKSSLWKAAKDGYEKYKQLAGKDAPGAAEINSFDLPTKAASQDVCGYFAEAYNRGRSKDISSPRGTVTLNGKTETFSAGWDGGSCSEPEIKFEGDLTEDELSKFRFAATGTSGEGGHEPTSIEVIPFHGRYYTVSYNDNGPYQLVDVEKGPLCNFAKKFTPTLVEGDGQTICKRFFEGKLTEKVNWSEPKEKIEPAGQNIKATALANFDGTALVDFQGGGEKTSVGHFVISGGGGCGCEQEGVALLKGNAMMSEEPNTSLMDAQSRWWSCYNAAAGLVLENGKTYVDAWAGPMAERENPPRVLLELKDNKFEPICRIEQIPSVTPISSTGSN
jgi:hypothetical protein